MKLKGFKSNILYYNIHEVSETNKPTNFIVLNHATNKHLFYSIFVAVIEVLISNSVNGYINVISDSI